jgi:hypothetical protein
VSALFILYIIYKVIDRIEVVGNELVIFDGDSIILLQETDQLQNPGGVDYSLAEKRFGIGKLVVLTADHEIFENITPDLAVNIQTSSYGLL